MVKLARGARRPGLPGRPEPVPLFPPGDLPVFGPPPANMRRGPPPPPRPLGHMPPPGAGFAPPLGRPHMPPPPPLRLGRPPMHPHMPPYPAVHRRPGPPPPPPPLGLRPLLQTPVLPPRPLPFIRGGGRVPMHIGRGPGGPIRRLGKNMKKSKNKKNKGKEVQKTDGNTKKNQSPGNNGLSKDVIDGPWITDVIKTELEKLESMKKEAELKKAQADWDLYDEQKKKVESMANAAKMEYIGSQPDGGEHYCDVCDKAWDTPEELSQHIESHVICGIDDCTFTAHSKIVQVHVKLQHATGLFNRIVRTYDREDIDKWIAERKRKYPTQENIERNNAIMKEKEERGERLHGNNPRFGKTQSGKGRSETSKQSWKQKKRLRKSDKIKYLPIYEDSSASEDFCETDNLVEDVCPVTDGNTDVGFNDNESDQKFSDDEWKIAAPLQSENSVCSALSALMDTYRSDESLSEGEIKDDKTNCTHNGTLENETTLGHSILAADKQCGIDNASMETNEAPLEVHGNRNVIDIPNIHVYDEKKEKLKNKKYRKKVNKPIQKPTKVHKTNVCLTLLEKLLKNEIRHERNYILQCVRFAIKNNFFDES